MADVNGMDETGRAAIDYAADFGHFGICEFLRAHGGRARGERGADDLLHPKRIEKSSSGERTAKKRRSEQDALEDGYGIGGKMINGERTSSGEVVGSSRGADEEPPLLNGQSLQPQRHSRKDLLSKRARQEMASKELRARVRGFEHSGKRRDSASLRQPALPTPSEENVEGPTLRSAFGDGGTRVFGGPTSGFSGGAAYPCPPASVEPHARDQTRSPMTARNADIHSPGLNPARRLSASVRFSEPVLREAEHDPPVQVQRAAPGAAADAPVKDAASHPPPGGRCSNIPSSTPAAPGRVNDPSASTSARPENANHVKLLTNKLLSHILERPVSRLCEADYKLLQDVDRPYLDAMEQVLVGRREFGR